MNNQEESKMVRAGSQTYFFDVKKTQKGASFLIITESLYKGEGVDRERSCISVFPEHADAFVRAMKEMVGRLK